MIVPLRTGPEQDFRLAIMGRTVRGWSPDRYFLAVPPGSSAMKVTLSAPEGTESKASIERIFDPNGARYRDRGRLVEFCSRTTLDC